MASDLTLSAPRLDLSPMVDVDLIRYERNLLRIGFFAAQQEDRKGQPPPYKRRIEAEFSNHEGQRVLSAIEFESTCGLPATADRDKYMGFMKIADEQRSLYGAITNPIRFTGYRLLQELGLSDSGENYEDINSWGERMAKTTITSRQVIYVPKSKRYANKTIHVFESFERVGDTSDKKTAEVYQVVLADWLLDNLNTDFAIAEDFNAYKALERDTAKGLFPLLHWWFASNGCREFQKDYKDLCVLLGIKEYKYHSEIKRTMGKAFEELVSIDYLSAWEIRRKDSENAYKIIIWPGDELKKRLVKQLPKLAETSQTNELTGSAHELPADAESDVELPQETEQALNELKAVGINKTVSQSLLKKYGPSKIIDVAEYVSSQKATDQKVRIKNMAGLIIHYLRESTPIPASFITSREHRAIEAATLAEQRQKEDAAAQEWSYRQWKNEKVDAELVARYPGDSLNLKLQEIATARTKDNVYFARVTPDQRLVFARQALAKEISEKMQLLSFRQWCDEHKQYTMFQNPE
jgi:hypothetical protein